MDKEYLYNSKEFSYYGMWQEKDGAICSYWNCSSLKFDFTGSCILINMSSKEPVTFILDNLKIENKTVENSYYINTACGKHTLKIISDFSSVRFKSVCVPKEEKIIKSQKNTYIKFIGDSITNAKPGFSYFVPEKLGVEYSVQAYCGMSLVDGWGWYKWESKDIPRIGMETACFTLEQPSPSGVQTKADFIYHEMPDIISVFLGTNDYLDNEVSKNNGNVQKFAEHYYEFVKKLKSIFPVPRICIMQALSDKCCRREGIDSAYEKIKEEFKDTLLIPSDKWDIELADGTHPTEKGYGELNKKLVSFYEQII